jgi:hypothetical protein
MAEAIEVVMREALRKAIQLVASGKWGGNWTDFTVGPRPTGAAVIE